MSIVCLLRIYPTILVPICSDWISSVDLGRLDTAVCCSWRNQFLETLGRCHLQAFGDADYRKWVSRRGMSIGHWIADDSLSKTDRQILSRCRYLSLLVVRTNGSVSQVLELCPVVHKLELRSSTDSDFLSVLPILKSLQCLNTVASRVTSKVNCALIDNLPYLRELTVSHEVTSVIEFCKELEKIDVPYSPGVLQAVAGVRCLKSLSIRSRLYTLLTNDELSALLSNCHMLDTLDMTSCGSNDAFVVSLAMSCPLLTSLILPSCSVSDDGMQALSRRCPKLKTLTLSSNSIVDSGIAAVAHGCPQLTSLSLDYCTALTDVGVRTVLTTCIQLVCLRVTSNRLISDAALCDAFTICLTLRLLDLYCDRSTQLTPAIVVAIIKDMESISIDRATFTCYRRWNDESTKLELTLGGDFEANIFQAVFQQCPHLKSICVADRKDFGKLCVMFLLQYCPLIVDAHFWYCSLSNSDIVEVCSVYSDLQCLDWDADYEVIQSLFTSHMEKLQILNLSICTMHNNILDEVAQFGVALVEIELEFCKGINGVGVSKVIRSCCKLTKLRVLDCPQVGIDILQTVLDVKRHMREMKYSGKRCGVNMTQEVVEELSVQLKPWVKTFVLTLKE